MTEGCFNKIPVEEATKNVKQSQTDLLQKRIERWKHVEELRRSFVTITWEQVPRGPLVHFLSPVKRKK